MMFHLGHLGSRRQGQGQMAFPSGGVLSGAPSARLGVVQHYFYPSAHPSSRLGLGVPDRLQRGQNVRRLDSGYRHLSKMWIGIGGKRIRPLACVFGALPAGLVGLNVFAGGLFERDRLYSRILRRRHFCRRISLAFY